MRILLVGSTGTIGTAVRTALAERGHDVVEASASRGPHLVDLGDPESIERLYRDIGPVRAVVCTAGVARFGALESLTDQDLEASWRNKLMGQVELVRHGLAHVEEGGSFTLTSGTLSTRPGPGTVAVSMTGAALEAFARASALDLAERFRINVVSPGWVSESRMRMGLDPEPGIRAKDLAAYYVRCVEGSLTGSVLEAEGPLPA